MDHSSTNVISELTQTLTNLATKPPKIHIDPSTMLALIPVILAQLSSDFGPLLRIAHDRPCLRWALALTCTRPLSVWRDKVHLDDLIEEPNPHVFTRTSVLLQRLASTNSLCNSHLVKVLGDIERSKSYGTVGCGLLPLVGVLAIYAAMMAISYHFASQCSLLAAKLSLAVFFSQMLTGLFSTYDRQLTDQAGQRQRHADRLFARIRHASLKKSASSPPTPTKSQQRNARESNAVANRPRTRSITSSTILGGNLYRGNLEESCTSSTPAPTTPSVFIIIPTLFQVLLAGLYWLHTRLILTFPSLVAAHDLEVPHSEDAETDIAIEAKIAGWSASFQIPLKRIEENDAAVPSKFSRVKEQQKEPIFTKYRYTFSNMVRVKSGPKWVLGLLIRVARWLRLEWILILGQLTAWGAIVTGPLQAALWIGLTQTIGTLLIFAGVYFITLGDSYKDDRILAAFRLADPEVGKGVFLLPHHLARGIWNDVRCIFRAERVYDGIMRNASITSEYKRVATITYVKKVNEAIERYSELEKKHKDEINSNGDTAATCNFFYDWLLIAKSEDDHGRIHEEVESWEKTVDFDWWLKNGENLEEMDLGFSEDEYGTGSKPMKRPASVHSEIPNPYYRDEVEPKGGRVSRAGSRRSARRPPLTRRTTAQELENIEPLLSTFGETDFGPITTPEQPPPSTRRPSVTATATAAATPKHQPPFTSSSAFIDPSSTRNQRLSADSTMTRQPASAPTSEGELTYASDSSGSSSPPPPAIAATQPSNSRPRTTPQFKVTNPTPPRTRINSNNNLGPTQSQPIISSKGNWRNLPDGEENARKYYANKKAQEMEERKMKAVITKLFDGVEDSQDGGSIGGGLFDPQSATSSTTLPPPSDQPRFPRPSHGRSISLDSITENDIPLPHPLPASTTTTSTPHATQFAPVNNQSSLNFESGGTTPRPTSTHPLDPPIDLTTTQQHPLDASQPPLPPSSETSPPSPTEQDQ